MRIDYTVNPDGNMPELELIVMREDRDDLEAFLDHVGALVDNDNDDARATIVVEIRGDYGRRGLNLTATGTDPRFISPEDADDLRATKAE